MKKQRTISSSYWFEGDRGGCPSWGWILRKKKKGWGGVILKDPATWGKPWWKKARGHPAPKKSRAKPSSPLQMPVKKPRKGKGVSQKAGEALRAKLFPLKKIKGDRGRNGQTGDTKPSQDCRQTGAEGRREGKNRTSNGSPARRGPKQSSPRPGRTDSEHRQRGKERNNVKNDCQRRDGNWDQSQAQGGTSPVKLRHGRQGPAQGKTAQREKKTRKKKKGEEQSSRAQNPIPGTRVVRWWGTSRSPKNQASKPGLCLNAFRLSRKGKKRRIEANAEKSTGNKKNFRPSGKGYYDLACREGEFGRGGKGKTMPTKDITKSPILGLQGNAFTANQKW